MKISGDNLLHHLAKGLAPLYVIHGGAPLLAIEAADSVRTFARKAGYTEREVMTVEPGFRWAELRSNAQSLSLFSTQKLVDLRIPSGKPGTEGAQALQDYCKELYTDTVTLITLPQLDKAALSSKWFTALSTQGVVIDAGEVLLGALPDWIERRLKQQNQFADTDTLAFLAERVENNLLAAHQEIQKLALLFPAGSLSLEQVKESVTDVARYNVFNLSEAMLAGDEIRYAHILGGLRAEGTAAVLVLWALAENIRTLGKVLRATKSGGSLASAMRDARVWGAHQRLTERAVKRFSLAIAERALRQASHVDKIVKGLRRGDVWDELLQLGLRCARVGTT